MPSALPRQTRVLTLEYFLRRRCLPCPALPGEPGPLLTFRRTPANVRNGGSARPPQQAWRPATVPRTAPPPPRARPCGRRPFPRRRAGPAPRITRAPEGTTPLGRPRGPGSGGAGRGRARGPAAASRSAPPRGRAVVRPGEGDLHRGPGLPAPPGRARPGAPRGAVCPPAASPGPVPRARPRRDAGEQRESRVPAPLRAPRPPASAAKTSPGTRRPRRGLRGASPSRGAGPGTASPHETGTPPSRERGRSWGEAGTRPRGGAGWSVPGRSGGASPYRDERPELAEAPRSPGHPATLPGGHREGGEGGLHRRYGPPPGRAGSQAPLRPGRNSPP